MKKLKDLLRRIPRLSRPQRVFRNFAVILLLAVAAWFLMGTPALTARWGYRRAERMNLLEAAEIVDVVKLENGPTVVTAESGSSFLLWCDRFHYDQTDLTVEEKREPVSLMMPIEFNELWDQIPWVLITELPAARGEVEFTLIPGISDQYIQEEVHYLIESELLKSGNLLFVVDLAEADYREEHEHWVKQDVEITLSNLSEARYNIQQTCRVDIAVRLWDANGNLIYDEILKNGVEVIDNEN